MQSKPKQDVKILILGNSSAGKTTFILQCTQYDLKDVLIKMQRSLVRTDETEQKTVNFSLYRLTGGQSDIVLFDLKDEKEDYNWDINIFKLAGQGLIADGTDVSKPFTPLPRINPKYMCEGCVFACKATAGEIQSLTSMIEFHKILKQQKKWTVILATHRDLLNDEILVLYANRAKTKNAFDKILCAINNSAEFKAFKKTIQDTIDRDIDVLPWINKDDESRCEIQERCVQTFLP